MKLRWILGVLACGSLMACMVPDVTKKADLSTAPAPTDSSTSGNRTSALQATTGAPLTATDGTAVQEHRTDGGAPIGSSAQSGEDTPDPPTFDPGSDAGVAETACVKLLDCCDALRNAGRTSDADACDNTSIAGDQDSCFLTQDNFANPTDGTAGVCEQP